jgi:hypothetical protein
MHGLQKRGASVVPGPAGPKSLSSGLAFEGSGFAKVKPEPSLVARQGPGPSFGLAAMNIEWITKNVFY